MVFIRDYILAIVIFFITMAIGSLVPNIIKSRKNRLIFGLLFVAPAIISQMYIQIGTPFYESFYIKSGESMPTWLAIGYVFVMGSVFWSGAMLLMFLGQKDD